MRLSARNVERILEQNVNPSSLRLLSLNDSVMVFEMEIAYNTSTMINSLLSRARIELCQTKVPGTSKGRYSNGDGKNNSSKTGADAGGVLGALFVTVLGIVMFLLYR
ncbi:uncharacterized protein LOC117318481 [Pecten maximus]|uniref:uncharacterized protein LOC117318481 n=1 Tax=Pecten maximus TaxID=6579 RepID=UPI001458FF58|nr:uncharacterized protein LOC117318481 [Pecten maximus]